MLTLILAVALRINVIPIAAEPGDRPFARAVGESIRSCVGLDERLTLVEEGADVLAITTVTTLDPGVGVLDLTLRGSSTRMLREAHVIATANAAEETATICSELVDRWFDAKVTQRPAVAAAPVTAPVTAPTPAPRVISPPRPSVPLAEQTVLAATVEPEKGSENARLVALAGGLGAALGLLLMTENRTFSLGVPLLLIGGLASGIGLCVDARPVNRD